MDHKDSFKNNTLLGKFQKTSMEYSLNETVLEHFNKNQLYDQK
jgi:hypothetical protein